ncbi:terminase small subunit [Facklamia hominis]|uniref:terminase small subunit n=1 Tax=Facklamia hominis TaxID=178214 RepID=UPI00288C4210|nr:terminase small subunit [Facklamia hominis]
MSKLTLKQQRFADEYIISGNATEAAIKAGYSKRTARSIGQENLTKPDIKDYIDERLEVLKSEKVADQQEVMEFLTSVMRGEVTEPMAVGKGEGYQEVMHVLPNVSTRRAAAVDIGKRYGMWTEKQDVNLAGSISFIEDVPEDD